MSSPRGLLCLEQLKGVAPSKRETGAALACLRPCRGDRKGGGVGGGGEGFEGVVGGEELKEQ